MKTRIIAQLICYFIISCCISIAAKAQWIQTNGPTFSPVYKLTTMGDRVLAATSDNGVMFTTDNGETWLESNSGIAPKGTWLGAFDLVKDQDRLFVAMRLNAI